MSIYPKMTPDFAHSNIPPECDGNFGIIDSNGNIIGGFAPEVISTLQEIHNKFIQMNIGKIDSV